MSDRTHTRAGVSTRHGPERALEAWKGCGFPGGPGVRRAGDRGYGHTRFVHACRRCCRGDIGCFQLDAEMSDRTHTRAGVSTRHGPERALEAWKGCGFPGGPGVRRAGEGVGRRRARPAAPPGVRRAGGSPEAAGFGRRSSAAARIRCRTRAAACRATSSAPATASPRPGHRRNARSPPRPWRAPVRCTAPA